jgi:DNA binding domain, excisionase family
MTKAITREEVKKLIEEAKTAKKEVYSLHEVEELLQVTQRSLYNFIKDGRLRAFKAGREWRVTREALEDFTKGGLK